MKKKIGVLLVNLGTPDSPSVGDVRKYLFQFLNDPRVIDLPWLGRFLLVNFIIVPFRAFGSAKIYKELWTDKGSPLLLHGIKLKEDLQKVLDEKYDVELAMRYQSPSMESVLERMRMKNYDQIIVLPLYPQNASSTTGSTIERAMKIIGKWWVIPELSFVSQYYDHDGYIESIVKRAQEFNLEDYGHVMFSYHGLPDRHIDKVYLDGVKCKDHNCEEEVDETNKFCYKATCYATTRLIAEKLGLKESQYTVAFQSRLDKNWLSPFADKVVIEKAKEGIKKMLVFSPAFTADCLETTIEIGEEYQELFEEHGGEKIQLVPSLNTMPEWVNTLKDIVEKRTI